MNIRILDIVQIEDSYLVLFETSLVSGTAQLWTEEAEIAPGSEIEVQTELELVSQFEVLEATNGRKPGMKELPKPGDFTVTGKVEAIKAPEIYLVQAGEARFSVERKDPGSVADVGAWVQFTLHGLVLRERA